MENRAEMQDIISLGAGVQSSTMALMAAKDVIRPMPGCAIFADTGWEPKQVYLWLDWLETQLPFPVYRVAKSNIRHDNVFARSQGKRTKGVRWGSLPYFTKAPGDTKEGRVMRQCTSEYKIQPIENFIKRNLLGIPKGKRLPKEPVVMQWRGISIDEASRMKPSRERWMTVRYPLAMELRMSRHDCLLWMQRNGYPEPPRSACIGCPFHSDAEWLDLKNNRPEEWEDACAFDEAIRVAKGMDKYSYLHRSCIPLRDVQFKVKDEKQTSLFANECEGMCGL